MYISSTCIIRPFAEAVRPDFDAQAVSEPIDLPVTEDPEHAFELAAVCRIDIVFFFSQILQISAEHILRLVGKAGNTLLFYALRAPAALSAVQYSLRSLFD